MASSRLSRGRNSRVYNTDGKSTQGRQKASINDRDDSMKITNIMPPAPIKICEKFHSMAIQELRGEPHVVCKMCGYNYPVRFSTNQLQPFASSSKITL